MKIKVYRNLDKQFVLFGIKEGYIPAAAVGLVVIILFSVLIGSAVSSFMGLATAVVTVVCGYLLLIEFQHHFSNKNLRRKMTGAGLPHFIINNSRIWRKLT